MPISSPDGDEAFSRAQVLLNLIAAGAFSSPRRSRAANIIAIEDDFLIPRRCGPRRSAVVPFPSPTMWSSPHRLHPDRQRSGSARDALPRLSRRRCARPRSDRPPRHYENRAAPALAHSTRRSGRECPAPAEGDDQMREIAADADPLRRRIERRRLGVGRPVVVLNVPADPVYERSNAPAT